MKTSMQITFIHPVLQISNPHRLVLFRRSRHSPFALILSRLMMMEGMILVRRRILHVVMRIGMRRRNHMIRINHLPCVVRTLRHPLGRLGKRRRGMRLLGMWVGFRLIYAAGRLHLGKSDRRGGGAD